MNNLNWQSPAVKYILLAALIGIITTVFTYDAGTGGNYLELTPILTRTLDPSYLQNDFFTNATANSPARMHYANFVTFFARSESSLPLVSFLLTMAANTGISIITFFFTRDLYRKSDHTAIIASALVMSVSTFALGWRSTIYMDSIIPAALAMPLVLAGIWTTAREKLLLGILFCGMASLLHPLLGLEVGAALLAAYTVSHLIRDKKLTWEMGRAVIPSLILFAVFTMISFLPQMDQPTIASERFIFILAYIRTPHHRLPSTFGFGRFAIATAFLTAALLLYFRSKKSRDAAINLFIGILAGIIILLCLGGYLFVEIIPSRLWVTAQTFRLLYFIQWFGLILVAGLLGDMKLQRSSKNLYLVGVLHGLTLGGVVLAQAVKEWLTEKGYWFSQLIDNALILLIAVAILIHFSPPILPIILLSFYILLILVFTLKPEKRLFILALAGIILLITAGIVFRYLPPLGQGNLIDPAGNNLETKGYSELGAEGDEIAFYARQNTPEDAVFLTPPTWGAFRVRTRRAIVVDFKAFPFSDLGMQEWYQRLTASYGESAQMGFEMIDDLNAHYAAIDDATLLALQDKYGFRYAVLFSQTATDFEVLFTNDQYKIIDLDQ